MSEEQIRNRDTMMYEGEDSFKNFINMTNVLGYKYVVKCVPMLDVHKEEVGAACRDEVELASMLLEFSYLGYAYRVYSLDAYEIEY